MLGNHHFHCLIHLSNVWPVFQCNVINALLVSEGFTPDENEEATRSIAQELAVDHTAIIIELLFKVCSRIYSHSIVYTDFFFIDVATLQTSSRCRDESNHTPKSQENDFVYCFAHGTRALSIGKLGPRQKVFISRKRIFIYRLRRFLDKIAKSYRKEQWYTLLTSSLEQALLCAQHLKSTQDYIRYSFDLISNRI